MEIEAQRAQFSHYVKAIIYGLVAAFIGAFIWDKLVLFTNFQVGIVAVFLAMGVGIAMRIGAEGRSGPAMPFLGAFLSGFCVWLGYAMLGADQTGGSKELASLGWALRVPLVFIALIFNPDLWVWLFTGIAAWQGWKINSQKVVLQGVKERVLKVIPEKLEFAQAYPDQFPLLDRATLEKWTEELQGLGFEWSQDYRNASRTPSSAPGMARLFLHKEQRCYAEIGQLFPEGKPPIVWCSIMSHLDGDWQLSTSNLGPGDPVTYTLRRPRALWSRHPGAEINALYQMHLDRRHRLAADLGLGVPEVSVAAYHAQQQRDAEARRAQVQGMTDAQLVLEHRAAKESAPLEWWGDWSAAAQARYGQAYPPPGYGAPTS